MGGVTGRCGGHCPPTFGTRWSTGGTMKMISLAINLCFCTGASIPLKPMAHIAPSPPHAFLAPAIRHLVTDIRRVKRCIIIIIIIIPTPSFTSPPLPSHPHPFRSPPLILSHPVLSVALPPSVPSTRHSHHPSPLHSFIPGLNLPFLRILPTIAFLFFFRTDSTDSPCGKLN